jgi:hypothetical protein
MIKSPVVARIWTANGWRVGLYCRSGTKLIYYICVEPSGAKLYKKTKKYLVNLREAPYSVKKAIKFIKSSGPLSKEVQRELKKIKTTENNNENNKL